MRRDEPYMPSLDWHPITRDGHGYHVILGGKAVCTISRVHKAWSWTAYRGSRHTGAEESALLAVRRAEAAYQNGD